MERGELHGGVAEIHRDRDLRGARGAARFGLDRDRPRERDARREDARGQEREDLLEAEITRSHRERAHLRRRDRSAHIDVPVDAHALGGDGEGARRERGRARIDARVEADGGVDGRAQRLLAATDVVHQTERGGVEGRVDGDGPAGVHAELHVAGERRAGHADPAALREEGHERIDRDPGEPHARVLHAPERATRRGDGAERDLHAQVVIGREDGRIDPQIDRAPGADLREARVDLSNREARAAAREIGELDRSAAHGDAADAGAPALFRGRLGLGLDPREHVGVRELPIGGAHHADHRVRHVDRDHLEVLAARAQDRPRRDAHPHRRELEERLRIRPGRRRRRGDAHVVELDPELRAEVHVRGADGDGAPDPRARALGDLDGAGAHQRGGAGPDVEAEREGDRERGADHHERRAPDAPREGPREVSGPPRSEGAEPVQETRAHPGMVAERAPRGQCTGAQRRVRLDYARG